MTAIETAQKNFAHTTVGLKCQDFHIETTFPAKDGEDIYPGMLLTAEEDTDGVWSTIKQTIDAATDDGKKPVVALAMEKGEAGETVHDVYDDGENVIVLLPQKGDFVLARVLNGESIVTEDYLVSNGDGTVRVADDATETLKAVFVALEACDMAQTDEDDEIALVKCVVL
jgi:hypothetical protein